MPNQTLRRAAAGQRLLSFRPRLEVLEDRTLLNTGSNPVLKLDSSTVVGSSANPQTAGQAVTWTATVTLATGSVNFVNFESGDFSQTASQTNATIVTSPALNGQYSVQLNRNNSVANVEIRQSGTTYYSLPTAYYSFAFEYASNPGDGSLVNFQDNQSGYKAAIHLSPSDHLEFYDINGTLLATGSTVLQPNTVYTLSARIGSGSTAAWQVLLNGNVELSGTGNFGTLNNGSIKLGGDNRYTSNYYYDDVQINSQSYPGPVPTGTLQFAVDGSTLGGPVPLSDGMATSPSDSTLSAGTHTVMATYSGDSNYAASSGTFIQTIQAYSNTVVSSSANPQSAGQAVTWTATVTLATGSVNFVNFESGDFSQTASQTNATIVTSPALNGQYSVQLNRNNSVANVEIRQSGTTYYSLPTAYYSFAFEYASNPGDGSLVNFQDNQSGYKAAIHLSPSDHLEFYDINGTLLATGSTVLQPNTVYTLSARIGSGSTAAWQVLLNGNVELSGTGNFGTLNNGSIKLGGDNRYTSNYYYDDVQINSQSYPGPVPTGTLQFAVDGSTLGGPVPLSDGMATSPSDSSLSAGMHTITATYNGDTSFSSSISGPFREIVTQATTTTTFNSSVNPSVFGQPVILTASVIAATTAADLPAGTVTFWDGRTLIGTASLDATGDATFTTMQLSVGPHTIMAQYSGDPDFSGSSSGLLSDTVNPAATLTTVSASVTASAFGQPVTFTVTVALVLPATGVPTGTVTFFSDRKPIPGMVTLNGVGQASLTTSALGVGTHMITAVYNGDSSFLTSGPSFPLALSITLGGTITTLLSSANPSVFGQPITFTASVTAAFVGLGPPTGMVTFWDGTNMLRSSPVSSSGVATFSLTMPLAVGTYAITASYNGDNQFIFSSSAPVTQTVTMAATAIAMISSPNPSTSNEVVTFTATVIAMAPATGTPTGTVTWRDGTTTLGTALLSSTGTATLGVVVAPTGTHSIMAVYSGDNNYASSTSAILSQTANGLATVLSPNPAIPTSPIPSSPSSLSGSQTSATQSTPASKSSITTSGDADFIGPAGNGIPLGLAVRVVGPVSTSSGTSLSAESIHAPEAHAGAPLGPGSGSDEIAGQRNDPRVGDLLAPRFEPGLPASNDIISGIDLAGDLLTGRPTVSFLPQKEHPIAPVPAVVSGGAGDDLEGTTDPFTDEDPLWPPFVIGLDDTIDRRPVVAPDKGADRSGAARIPAGTRCLVDQVFERGLPAVLHEMVSQPAPEQAGTVAAMLGAALLVAGLWQTSRTRTVRRWHSEPLRAAHARRQAADHSRLPTPGDRPRAL